MYGILTGDASVARESIGDVTYYLTERVDGERSSPIGDAINSVACWGDTGTVSADPDRAAVSADGRRATPTTEGHHWGTVCPTDPDYRADLLDRLEAVGAVGDVRLTTLGFPGESFCHCERCTRRFDRSDEETRVDWRTSVITEFVADAADRIEGSLVATLYPDPYPGHLRERAGLDPAELDPHVDEFLVPLCGEGYETSYWVESLARGFATRLADLDAAFAVQLAADGADTDRLVRLARNLDEYADTVAFGTASGDVDRIRDVLRRVDASGTEPPRVRA